MSLVAAELERQGIATVAIQLLREVAEQVRPPRALVVPFPFGRPLGAPGDAAGQRAVLEAALAILEDPSRTPPVLVRYRGGGSDPDFQPSGGSASRPAGVRTRRTR